MGYEFKIEMKPSEAQREALENLLEDHPMFSERDLSDALHFRTDTNDTGMPDFVIAFESDGLYVCKYGSSDLWQDLDGLKQYLVSEGMAFEFYEL